MEELQQALKILNDELAQDGIELNLNIVGGFSLSLQNLSIDVRESHDIDTLSELTANIKERVKRIGEELHLDLRWLNDDLLSLYADFEFAGIHFEELKFSPSEKINLSNIHLNVIDIVDFLKLKLFALFTEVHDFLQYNKAFERTQDLQDIKTIVQLDDTDCKELLNKITNYMHDTRCRDLTSALLDAYLAQTLSNAQVNEFLKENRLASYASYA
jgi:hypothetical protein